MRPNNWRLFAAGAAIVLLAAACGGGGSGGDGGSDGGGGGPTAQTIKTTEYKFDPASFSIPADTDVTIEVDNTGGVIEHDFTIDEGGGTTIHANPGTKESGTISLPAATYTFYCSVPGHRQLGMEGELTVG